MVHILKGELPIEQIESAIFKPIEEKDLVNVSALVLESVISILSLIILLGIPWVGLVIWFNYISYSCPYLFKGGDKSLLHMCPAFVYVLIHYTCCNMKYWHFTTIFYQIWRSK